MIRAVVAKFQFEGFAAESEAAELMAEADTENGDATKEFLNIFDGVADGLWIAGAIGKKNTVWLEIENVLSAGLRGDDPDFAVMIDQQPEYVLFDTEIVSRDAKFGGVRISAGLAHGFRPGRNREFDGAFCPAVSLFATDAAGKLLTSHDGQLLGFEN